MRTAISPLQPARASKGQHPGLLLQRYLCEQAPGEGSTPEKKEKEKAALLQAAIQASGDADLNALYKAAFDRWQSALPELTAANDLKTVGRLIVGLGTENVLETGIRLHHTYGMPILPGSALKGLAAHYCHQVWGTSDDKFRREGNYHRLLFGTTDESGCLRFYDAWFVPHSERYPLHLDVMTPHHPRWLDGSVPPTDFDCPTPVPFLSVSGQFHCAISWHGPEHYDRSVAWTEMGFELLLGALTHWGIGGKTTSGYGRLTEPEPGKRKKPFSASAMGLPTMGAVIDAKLQEAPRKGRPWRATVLFRSGKERSGPIEGTAPGSAQVGQMVRLVVTQVDDRSIKFKWPDTPDR